MVDFRKVTTLRNPLNSLANAAAILAVILFWTAPAGGAQILDSQCMECHSTRDDTTSRPSVDYNIVKSSSHAKLACTDCHQDISSLPHADSLQHVDCMGCHQASIDQQGKSIEKWRDSVHGRARAHGGTGNEAATCVDCHGKHDVRGKDDPKSTVYRLNIPLTCARCHEDNQVVIRHDIHAEAPYQEYEKSVHGKALYQDGLLQVAAVCTDCHGVHTIQAAADSVPMAAQPTTCGKCHVSVYDTYHSSIHGQLHIDKHDPDAPGCVDCHGEHGIQSPEASQAPTSAANIPKTCAHCHADEVRMGKYDISTDRMKTYEQSFHGVASGLGELNAANCASCHGYHDIYPSSDPRSSVNPQNMLKTCGKCHPKATANFISGKIHVNVEEQSAGAVFYLRRALIWLVWATAGLLVVWVGIDISRKLRTRKHGQK